MGKTAAETISAMLTVFGRIDPQRRHRKRQWTLTSMAAASPGYRPNVRRGNPGDRPLRKPHAAQMPRLQDAIPGLARRAWQGRSNPLLLTPLHLAPESRASFRTPY